MGKIDIFHTSGLWVAGTTRFKGYHVVLGLCLRNSGPTRHGPTRLKAIGLCPGFASGLRRPTRHEPLHFCVVLGYISEGTSPIGLEQGQPSTTRYTSMNPI
jgi:hypothetical protein